MKSGLAAPLLLICMTAPVLAGGPAFDPFVEHFAVGNFADPAQLEWTDGWPAGLWEPAQPDTVWLAKARRLGEGFGGGPRFRSLRGALPAGIEMPVFHGGIAWSGRGITAPGPLTGDLDRCLAAAAALAAGDTLRARALARALAAEPGATGAEKVVWSLRAASLAPSTSPTWAAVDTLLGDIGPWDAANAWALAVYLRRQRGEPVIPPGSSDAHGRRLGSLSRNQLTVQDITDAPYSIDMKGALGAVTLQGADLREHLTRHPAPPAATDLQGWWVRGQRRAAGGDPARYEELAARSDLHPRWRTDLWRRASERRLLAGNWSVGIDDLGQALAEARRSEVTGGLRGHLHIWAVQALVLALSLDRVEDAEDILVLIENHLTAAPDTDLEAHAGFWRVRLAGGTAPESHDPDRVAVARTRVRAGGAPAATRSGTEDRQQLATAPQGLWDLWLRWGLALTSQPGIPVARQAAARSYHDALTAARDAGAQGRGYLPAALERLAGHEGTWTALLTFAYDRDVRELVTPASTPLASPLPNLVWRHRGSQADLHALLGVALFLEDMRGVLAAATPLTGTGLTRDEKRRFLYPLPGPGGLRDALLAADNDPALLLAIARNESLFEPAARSPAGALGWMQVMPFHHRQKGALPGRDHWSDAASAVARGDGLITENRRRYRGDPYRLLAAYNAGPGAANRWDEQLGGSADRAEFLAWIGYTETRAYVEKVLIDKIIYDWILDGVPGTSD